MGSAGHGPARPCVLLLPLPAGLVETPGREFLALAVSPDALSGQANFISL